MLGRGKTKQAYSKGLKEDWISQLSDDLICKILCRLPTKEVVKTSALSTRWTSLWLCVPCLDLISCEVRDFNAFMSVCDKFFGSTRVSFIHRVKLMIAHEEAVTSSHLKSWIDVAVKHKIQHLDLNCPLGTDYEMPLRLYKCETLVSLKLYQVKVTLDDSVFVSLPCLKTLHLRYILNEATFERLVSCCPILEILKIFVDPLLSPKTLYRVLSMSLKKLKIRINENNEALGFRFLIDAPRLSFLGISGNYSDSFVINNMVSNAQVDISLPYGFLYFDEARKSSIRCFLTGISKVRDMTLCKDTFKLIREYSKSQPLPQFGFMSHLHVTLLVSDLKWLPTFLKSCANLKSLILVWNGSSKKMCYNDVLNHRLSFTSVPECLLSSLEFVDIKASIRGYFPEMKVVRYFLENSAILKKLTVRWNHYFEHEKVFSKMLQEIPKRSNACEIVVL